MGAGGAWIGRKPHGGSRDGGVEKAALEGTVLGSDRSADDGGAATTGLRSSGNTGGTPGLLLPRHAGSGGRGHQGPLGLQGPRLRPTATPGTRPSGRLQGGGDTRQHVKSRGWFTVHVFTCLYEPRR